MRSFPLWLSFAVHALAETRQFTFELTWKKGSPDGFEREMIFINDQFPGPLIKVNQDDWVEINVVNNMPFNSTLHAHGIEQLNTPWADGVPGLSQRHIQPGATYKYKWHAHQYGSYFYHAHSRGQIDDGAYGPIIIQPKRETKPFDKIPGADVALLEAAEADTAPIILSDWRHTTSQRTQELQIASGLESSICQDSLLVNGKGAVDCWSREEINQYTNPALIPLLQGANLSITDKGCIPPEALSILLGSSEGTDPSVLPDEVFKTCTPTKGSREVLKVNPQKKWVSLNVVSTASIATMAFSIDEHPIWIYAIDGHYIEPVKTDILTVANGDRFSVFVQLDKTVGAYGVRVVSIALPQLLDTTAVLVYDGGYGGCSSGDDHVDDYVIKSKPSINRAGVNTTSNLPFDTNSAVSFPPQFPQPAPPADQTLFLNLQPGKLSYVWALNSTPFDHAIDNSNPPLLFQDPSSAAVDTSHLIKTKNNTWVDLVFRVVTPGQPPHPIHKHSNRGFLIGAGPGDFNWTSVEQASKAVPQFFNFQTPPYRDNFVTIPSAEGPTWMAVRYHVVNPGAFMLHCHIQSHLDGGMAMAILDGTDEWPEVPEEYKK